MNFTLCMERIIWNIIRWTCLCYKYFKM